MLSRQKLPLRLSLDAFGDYFQSQREPERNGGSAERAIVRIRGTVFD
jgi:hypothetical protein